MSYLAAALPDPALSEVSLNTCRGAQGGFSALLRAELLLSNSVVAQPLSELQRDQLNLPPFGCMHVCCMASPGWESQSRAEGRGGEETSSCSLGTS